MDVIYLDHNASSPNFDELTEALPQLARLIFGSPSSLHSAGRKGRRSINEATEILGKFIDCEPEFIFWTSGASEANSWAIHSAIQAPLLLNQKPVLLISNQEHDSVLQAAKFYSKTCEIKFIKTLPNGLIDLNHLEELLKSTDRVDLVSTLFANNETGIIQPISEIITLCNQFNAPVHIDCVQALGKIPFSVKNLGARYTTFSAHKIGALKGVGWLCIQGEGKLLTPLIHGKQQKTLRGGTENTLAVASVGFVLGKHLSTKLIYNPELRELHDRFESELKVRVSGTIIHGEYSPRLCNTTFVGFEGIEGDGLLMNLDLEKICASSGSACTSGSLDPSHVLLAMGCDKEVARSSVRFSSGNKTTWNDFEKVLTVLPGIIERMR